MAQYIYLKDHAKHGKKKGDIIRKLNPFYATQFIDEKIIAECDDDGKVIKKSKKDE